MLGPIWVPSRSPEEEWSCVLDPIWVPSRSPAVSLVVSDAVVEDRLVQGMFGLFGGSFDQGFIVHRKTPARVFR